MSKKIQTIIVSVSVLGLAVFLGCAAVQDAIIPCYIFPATLDYAQAEPTTFLPFTTLFDAKRVEMQLDYRHQLNQIKDKLHYGFLKSVGKVHILAAEELQMALFSPTGPIGMAIPAIFGTSIGALLIKRPGDKSKKELEKT